MCFLFSYQYKTIYRYTHLFQFVYSYFLNQTLLLFATNTVPQLLVRLFSSIINFHCAVAAASSPTMVTMRMTKARYYCGQKFETASLATYSRRSKARFERYKIFLTIVTLDPIAHCKNVR